MLFAHKTLAMATTTVSSSPSSNYLHAEALPLIDLRLLSQSELLSLSLSSASSIVDLHRSEDIVIPTIDRSVFNESAGSRKQIYSRIRLSPRKRQPSSASNTIPRPIHPRSHLDNNIDDEENTKIVCLLKKELFAVDVRRKVSDFDCLIPVPVDYGDSVPKLSNAVLQTIEVGVAEDVGEGAKRKRGRPRREMTDVGLKTEGGNNDLTDRGIENRDGVSVDISALASMEDPYGPELRRQTEGMNTEDELLGFLGGLVGQWGSRRKKRKLVEASDFGDALPKRWKLLLSLKKKDGRAWLICRRYLSPCGREFISCKDISLYLISLLGPSEATVVGPTPESNQLTHVMHTGNNEVITFKDDIKADGITCTGPTNTDGKYPSTTPENQNLGEVQVNGEFNCSKCPMNFSEKDDLFHHIISAHKKSGKRRKLGTAVSDGVIIKDGIYECQFCHKTFHERHRYNGHVGIHVKKFVKSLEFPSSDTTVPKCTEPILTEMQITIPPVHNVISMPTISIPEDCTKLDPPSNIQVGSSVETCIKEHNNQFDSLSLDRPNIVGGKITKIINEESSDTKGKRDIITDSEMENNVDESFDIANAGVNCSHTSHEKIDEPNVLKSTCLIEDHTNGALDAVMEEPKQDLEPERDSLIPNVNETVCSVVNSTPFNVMEELKIGDSKEVASEYEQQLSFEDISLGCSVTKPKGDLGNNMERNVNFTIADSKEESCSEKGLLIPLYDGKECEAITVNRGSIKTLGDSNFGKLGYLEKFDSFEANQFGTNYATPNENCLPLISCNNAVEEGKLIADDNSEKMELIVSSSGSLGGLDVEVMTSFDRRKGSEDSSYNFMEELNQRRSSGSCSIFPSYNKQNNDNRSEKAVVKPKLDEIRNSWSSELFMGLGTSQSEINDNRNFEGDSIVFPGNENPFNVDNYDNGVQGTRHENGFRDSLFGNFGNDQLFGVENNSKQLLTGTGWGAQRLGAVESSRNNDLMFDFGNSLVRPVDDAAAVAEAMWRTNEDNIMHNSLPDPSLTMAAQSSNCFTAFDFISDKGGNDLYSASGNFGGISGYEEIRTSNMEQMEYNFFSPQTNSLANDPKVMSYDVDMEQAFGSALWLGNESLLPKTSMHYFTAICVWCDNEFQHEVSNSATQTGSIGSICPTCKAKISDQLNVL